MPNDLTNSAVERQNILNNPYAVTAIQQSVGLQGIEYHGKTVLLREQVTEFFEITPRTMSNYLAANDSELRANGYEVVRGKALQELKLAIKEQLGKEIDFPITSLGVFDFRAFLNLAMLIAESERARLHINTVRLLATSCQPAGISKGFPRDLNVLISKRLLFSRVPSMNLCDRILNIHRRFTFGYPMDSCQ